MSVMREMVVGPAPAASFSTDAGTGPLSKDGLLRTFRLMALTRALDDKAWTLNRQGKISFVAPARGHEACQVGSALALRAGHDIVFTYYRDIGVAMTLGMDPREILMSSYAKRSPINGSSRHLPWHLMDPTLRLMPVTSVVATQIPQAAGAALASKLRREDVATIVYFGDGATSEGDFHEGMNWAGVHQLPLVLLCVNNGYAISVPTIRQMGVANVASRAESYGFEGVQVDGEDPVATYEATHRAVEKARRGGGPTLIEAKLHRLRAHSSDDDNRRYLNEQERAELDRHDPVQHFKDRLLRMGLLTPALVAEIEAEAKARIERATQETEAAEEANPENILTHVFAEDPA